MRSRIRTLERALSILLGCCVLALAIVTSRVTATLSAVEGVANPNHPSQVIREPSVHREIAAWDQRDSEPQQAMDRADKLRANWTKTSLQEAIELYERAALIWTSASEFESAPQATLNSEDA